MTLCLYDPIKGQGQGHGGLKWVISKFYLLWRYARNQKTNSKLCCSKTISKF